MPNASPADARAGYEVFRASGFEAARGEINERLEQSGYSPISDRMYRHYRRLAANGYNRYISINRLDVATASEPYEDFGSDSRYRYIDTSTGVRVTFPRGRRLVEAHGQAERIGEAGLLLRFEGKKILTALTADSTRPHIGELLRIEFLDPPGQFDARVVELERAEKHVVIEVEFARLQSITEYIGRDPLPLARFKIRLVSSPPDDSTVDVLGRQLYYLFEVIESSRAVVNEAAGSAEDDRYAPITRVHRMRMASPLDVLVGVPEPVGYVVGVALGLLALAKSYETWRRKRLENNSIEIENKVKEAKAELEKAALALESSIVRRLRETFNLPENLHAEGFPTIGRLAGLVQNLAEQDVSESRVKRADNPKKTA